MAEHSVRASLELPWSEDLKQVILVMDSLDFFS